MFLSDSSIRERLISGTGLSKAAIIKKLEAGHIVLDPFPSPEELLKRLGPCSFDLQLGNKIRESHNPRIKLTSDTGTVSYVHQTVDFRNPDTLDKADHSDSRYTLQDNEEYVLEPGRMVCAITKEFIGIPADLIGFLHSRSKIGRYGISSSYDAPKFDPGFVGQMVLEISNMGSRRFSLHPGLLISQVLFTQLDKPADNPYYKRAQSSWGWQSEP